MNKQPNIVLVVFDTLRRDYLSVYSGPVKVSAFEYLARDGVVFNNAIAPAPWSAPSHASIFTGKYPSEHGVHEDFERKDYAIRKLMMKVPYKTLPEKLRELGYNTIGISANEWISPGTGFERGFNAFTYVHPFDAVNSLYNEVIRTTSSLKNRGIIPRDISDPVQAARHLIFNFRFKEVIKLTNTYLKAYMIMRNLGYPLIKGGDLIIKHIENMKIEEPFFLFINFMEPHQPYPTDLPRLRLLMHSPLVFPDLFGYKKISEGIIKKLREDYKKEMHIINDYLWRIIAYLKRRNIYDNTLLIVAGDHGQEFKEEGYYGHAIYLHDEIINVPLIVKFPMNRKINTRTGYQSLTNIPNLILNAIENNYEDVVTTDVAFSEAFGITHELKKVLGNYMKRPDFNEKRRKIDCVRKAVLKNEYKLVINASLGTVEEFKYNGKPISIDENRDVARDLLDEIKAFIKNKDNREDVLIPDI